MSAVVEKLRLLTSRSDRSESSGRSGKSARKKSAGVAATPRTPTSKDFQFHDPLSSLPKPLVQQILEEMTLRDRTRVELVSRDWRAKMMEASRAETKPVWVYVIFRKNHCSGHEKMTVNISMDGPVFWNRQVAYVYCCSCHFEEHEGPLMAIFKKFEHRVERVCLVDKPVDYPFLPDSLFSYMALNMPRLQFIYLRELDLEKINRGTVVELANHNQLKKVIVHGCRNYEVLEDFHNLPQLLVVKGDIVGLKAMIGDFDMDPPKSASATSSSSSSSSVSGSSLSEPSEASKATVTTSNGLPKSVQVSGGH